MDQARTCIKCKHDMIPQLVQKVEVDVCPNCGGLWLDKDEIRELSKKSDKDLSDLRKILQQSEKKGFKPPTTVKEPCPACSGKLSVAVLGPIFVEHCTSCDGIYLDKGEMDEIIKILKVSGDKIATIVALAKTVVTSGTI
jgi:uncharacterized protein